MVEVIPRAMPESLLTVFPTPELRRAFGPVGPFRQTLEHFARLSLSCRAALHCVYRGLRREPGSVAWMPSVHCGAEVQAALDAGLEVAFYRVSSDLSIDIGDLERKMRGCPGPVLVIHYFGFGQPAIGQLASLCSGLGCLLIEDCAHALFSRHDGKELGAFAPLAAYSLRKSLPVYDGGALQVNDGPQGFDPPPQTGRSLVSYGLCVKNLVRSIVGERLTEAYRAFRWGVERDLTALVPPDLGPDPSADARMSRLSAMLAATVVPETVISRRRRNWGALASRLAYWTPVFGRLPEGVCPLAFPLWVKDRPSLIGKLRANGIEPYVFGAFHHPLLDRVLIQDSRAVREGILCLPLHQELTDTDIERVCATMDSPGKFATV